MSPVFSSNHVSKLAKWPSLCIFYGNAATRKHPITKRIYVLLAESRIRGIHHITIFVILTYMIVADLK